MMILYIRLKCNLSLFLKEVRGEAVQMWSSKAFHIARPSNVNLYSNCVRIVEIVEWQKPLVCSAKLCYVITV